MHQRIVASLHTGPLERCRLCATYWWVHMAETICWPWICGSNLSLAALSCCRRFVTHSTYGKLMSLQCSSVVQSPGTRAIALASGSWVGYPPALSGHQAPAGRFCAPPRSAPTPQHRRRRLAWALPGAKEWVAPPGAWLGYPWAPGSARIREGTPWRTPQDPDEGGHAAMRRSRVHVPAGPSEARCAAAHISTEL